MKKTYVKTSLMAGLLSALVMVGTACTNDDGTTLPEPGDDGITSFTATVPGSDTTTRVALDGSAIDNPTNPHIRVTWEMGETVKIFPTTGDPFEYTATSISASGKEATFTSNGTNMQAGPTNSYNIYGPGDKVVGTNTFNLAFDYSGQIQVADNDLTHLRDYTFYAITSYQVPMMGGNGSTIPTDREFTHWGALMQFKLTIPEDIENLTTFTLSSSGTYSGFTNSGKAGIWYKRGSNNEYTTDLTLNLDGFDATAGQELNLWMMVPADGRYGNFPAGTLTLSLTNGTKTFTKDVDITTDQTFAAGGWYYLEAELEGPPVTGLQGGGVDGDPFLIHNAPELRFMRDQINNFELDYMYGFYRLENDITVGDESWLTEGSFAGDFDGNSKTISGITRPFFEGGIAGQQPPTMRYPIVKDLHFRDANISMGNGDEVYGITGLNEGIITGCSVQGTLTQTRTGRMNVYAGGIAKVNSGTITGCWVNITEFTLQSAITSQNAGYIVYQNNGTVQDNAWVTVSSGFIPNVDHTGFGTPYNSYQELEDNFLAP